MNTTPVVTFAKYTLVGAIGVVCDTFALYLFIEYTQMDLLVATTLAFLISVIINFILHKKWTFKDRSHEYRRQFESFFIISCVNLVVTVLLMHVFVRIVGIWYLFAKLITAIIVLVLSYTANRLWTFKHLKTSKDRIIK